MRKSLAILVAALLIAAALPAIAELQNVQVGGEVRIRGNFIDNNYATPGPVAVRVPSLLGRDWLSGRPIGDMFSYIVGGPRAARGNGLGVLSPYSWDNDTSALKMIEQRTRLNVKADFTNEVSAFIELDNYEWWGGDFRSNYITGVDSRAVSTDDVEMYQAYIEANNMFGMPLRARIGRQELCFGSEWLVGNKDFGPYFVGRSFDAIRLTYATDTFSVDAFASKLAEGGVAEEDGDVDFYGIYTSCMAVEDWKFDAYWLWLRDARGINDTNFGWFPEWIEDWFGVDDYDVTNLHTIGLRANGKIGAFDMNAEVAYQFGDANQVGAAFKPFLYGDDDAEYGAWGGTIDVGYTFDMAWQPRLHLAFEYLGGEDNRDINFWEWLSPFDHPKSSVSFNRLFSDTMYSGFMDLNNDLSNVWIAHGGVMAHPTEAITVIAEVSYFEALASFDSPVYWNFGRFNLPVAPAFSYWTDNNDSDLGWQLDLLGIYQYSEDLSFTLHLAALQPGDGLTQGAFSAWNGLLSTGGSDDDVAFYAAFDTSLKF